MDNTPLEDWIEKWGANLDWEAKAKLHEVFHEKEIAELKGQVSERLIAEEIADLVINRLQTSLLEQQREVCL